MATTCLQNGTKAIAPSATGFSGLALQRKCACGGSAGMNECDDCQGKKLSLQRSALNSEPATRNSELETQNSLGVPPIVDEVLRSPGQPLDPATRAFFEPRFGHSFADVRVHADDKAAGSARAMNALAYTVEREIVFGRRQYAPTTTAGQRLIAHELTHVIQQDHASRNGDLQTATADRYESVNAALEREADCVAERVTTGSNAGLLSANPAPAIQLQEVDVISGAGPRVGGGPASTRTITAINVDMNDPQNVSLDWSDGSHTSGIQCSTGQGHCCPRPCEPPKNSVKDSNCTPDGTFTVDNKYARTGHLNFFVSFVRRRQIGLHEYEPTKGTPLSHGCVRLHRDDAATVYGGTIPGTTVVNVSGLAVPKCPRDGVPNCPDATGAATGALPGGSEEALAENFEERSTGEIDPA